VQLQGRKVQVKTLIQEEICTLRLGYAAVTRGFVLDEYEEYFDFYAHQAGLPIVPKEMQEGDKICHCRDCKTDFVFSIGEQNFFKKNNLTDRARCLECHIKRKANMADSICPQFTAGSCSYGDSCRMKHGSNDDGLAALVVDPSAPSTDRGSDGEKPIVVTCRDCKGMFETDENYWVKKSLSLPKSCRSCREKKKKAALEISSCLVDCAFPIGKESNDY
jgi:hypothetical protein